MTNLDGSETTPRDENKEKQSHCRSRGSAKPLVVFGLLLVAVVIGAYFFWLQGKPAGQFESKISRSEFIADVDRLMASLSACLQQVEHEFLNDIRLTEAGDQRLGQAREQFQELVSLLATDPHQIDRSKIDLDSAQLGLRLAETQSRTERIHASQVTSESVSPLLDRVPESKQKSLFQGLSRRLRILQGRNLLSLAEPEKAIEVIDPIILLLEPKSEIGLVEHQDDVLQAISIKVDALAYQQNLKESADLCVIGLNLVNDQPQKNDSIESTRFDMLTRLAEILVVNRRWPAADEILQAGAQIQHYLADRFPESIKISLVEERVRRIRSRLFEHQRQIASAEQELRLGQALASHWMQANPDSKLLTENYFLTAGQLGTLQYDHHQSDVHDTLQKLVQVQSSLKSELANSPVVLEQTIAALAMLAVLTSQHQPLQSQSYLDRASELGSSNTSDSESLFCQKCEIIVCSAQAESLANFGETNDCLNYCFQACDKVKPLVKKFPFALEMTQICHPFRVGVRELILQKRFGEAFEMIVDCEETLAAARQRTPRPEFADVYQQSLFACIDGIAALDQLRVRDSDSVQLAGLRKSWLDKAVFNIESTAKFNTRVALETALMPEISGVLSVHPKYAKLIRSLKTRELKRIRNEETSAKNKEN